MRFEKTDAYREFLAVYHRFVAEWIVPQLGQGALLYQRKPILRVVLPGSVPPTALHCDADYWHDANELNFWVPLTRVAGANSLWSETEPGKGDFAPFVAAPGQLLRFYGNRCRHYTIANDSGAPRVSFDFRVIPSRLFTPPSAMAERHSKHTLNPGISKRGYYALAHPPGSEEGALTPSEVAGWRRAWREEKNRSEELAVAPSK